MTDLLRTRLQSSLGSAYTLGRELGGGGMSRVFIARDEALGRDVVVKVLSPDLVNGLSAERFAREIRLVAALQDPHIVPVLAAGAMDDGLPYYTMPFVEGRSLRARLAAGPLPLAEALRILRDVAEALEHAHARGVVHRDVKPENVLLTGRGAVVADFGIAKAIIAATQGDVSAPGTLTQVGTSLGTPAYMAPEQAGGDPAIDQRADLYAWGILAWEALAGRHPFADRTTTQSMIAAQFGETPPSLATVRCGLPAALAALVARCLAKEPSQRPATAGELIVTLDHVKEVGPRPRRARGPRAIGLAVGAVLLLAAGGTVLLARRGERHERLDPQRVVVVPFRVAGADPGFRYLREGMLDLLAAKLIAEPHAVDQRAVLTHWRRAGGSETVDPEPEATLTVARDLGAGRLVQGEVVGSRERLTLNARLLEVERGGTRATASASGRGDALPVLVDSVVNTLLALDAGEGAQRAAALASIPLPALTSFLAGQAHYRAARYDQAVASFARALDADSTFALAGVMLYRAAGWSYDESRGDPGLATARRFARNLSPRDRLLLEIGDDGRPLPPTTSCAESLDRVERAVQHLGDVPEAWLELGDRWVHCGPAMVGEIEAWRRALPPLLRALEIDSLFVPAMEHLPEAYLVTGDTARAGAATLRILRDTGALYAGTRRLFAAHTPDEERSAVRRLRADASSHPDDVWYAILLGYLFNQKLDAARELRRALPTLAVTAGDRALVARYDHEFHMLEGRPSVAPPTDWSGTGAIPLLEALFWDGDTIPAVRALPPMTRAVDGGPPADTVLARAWADTAFDVAQWALSHADTARARAAMARLRRAALAPGFASRNRDRLVLLLDAQLAALERRSDAGARLAQLDSLLAEGPDGLRMRLVGNLVACRLWERKGDLARAHLAVTRWTAAPGATDLLFMSTFLRERGRLAERLGRRGEALRAYRHYLAMRPNPEPALRATDAEVRASLRRIERSRG